MDGGVCQEKEEKEKKERRKNGTVRGICDDLPFSDDTGRKGWTCSVVVVNIVIFLFYHFSLVSFSLSLYFVMML